MGPAGSVSENRDVPAARANLLRALARAGVEPRWSEHRIGDPDLPERVRGFGSPTVLVDGRDVAGIEPSSEVCCRIYDGARAPSVESIARALGAASPPESGTTASGASPRRARGVGADPGGQVRPRFRPGTRTGAQVAKIPDCLAAGGVDPKRPSKPHPP